MHSWKYIVYSLSAFTLLCPSAFADANSMRPAVTISGGVAITSDMGKSATLSNIDSSTYTYSPDKSQTQGIGGVFIGEEFYFSPNWFWQAGISYYRISSTAKGNLTQGADVMSQDHYRYDFNLVSQQVLFDNKFFLNLQEIYHPYLSVGIGAAFNHAYSYDTNVPPFLTFTPEFSNHSTSSFSYSVGVGADVDIPCNWRLGVGYRFTDLGRVSLGDGRIDTTPISGTLKQTHFYNHEILAQLTYLF